MENINVRAFKTEAQQVLRNQGIRLRETARACKEIVEIL